MAKTPDKHEQEAEAARRDLNRIQQQTERLTGPEYEDARREEEDYAEVWGRRIGRGLGIAFAIFLLAYLLNTYVF